MLRKRRLLTLLKGLDVGWWVVVLWLVGPYLVLTLSIYHEPRAITPVLPAIALLGAGLILQISWRAARTVVVVMLVFFGVVQFYAVSFERLHGLVEAASLRLPLLGETSLLGRGGYLQRPDAEATDSGYWIEPDVLERMERERLAQGWDSASLGLLVNDKQINFEHFAYLTLAGGYYPALTVERLARAHGPEPVYPRLFEHDFLLVKPENDAIDADSQAAIERILEDPSSLFQQSFELDKRYLLPDGGTVYLYRRLMRAPGGNTAEFFPKLADTLNGMAREGDAVVVIPPDLVPLLGQQQDKGLEVYALPNQESTDDVMAELAAEHDLVFAIYGEWDGDDLDDAGRRWLNERGYRAWQEWFGPTQLVVYGLASEAEGSEVKRVGAELGGAVTLDGYSLWDGQAEARDILYLTLLWQARQPLEQSYKVFVHLVDGDGRLVAQADSEPVAGLRPTTGWEVGETIRDQVGLWIPPELEPGAYALLVGMYDPETLERLPLLNATEEAVGDAVLLDSVLLPESRR